MRPLGREDGRRHMNELEARWWLGFKKLACGGFKKPVGV